MNSRTFRAFTWEVSVYFESISGNQTLLSWHDPAGNYSMSLFKNENNHIAFQVRTANETLLAFGRNSYGAGNWHHLAVSYDGGIAGEIRLYRLDTSGAAITRSDCLSGVCLTGNVSGTIGSQGSGFGDGILLRSGTTSGCSQGLIISAVGGGKCKAASATINNRPCLNASDCGVDGQCIVGYDFSAVVTSVGPLGEISQVKITNPGRGYSSNPKLIVNSDLCTCNGAPGNSFGNLDPCIIAIRSTGRTERKSNFRWIREDSFPVRWSNLAGWGDAGDTSGCSESSSGSCPFVSPKVAGWRWTVGMGFECSRSACSPGNFLIGSLDEIRISSTALDLEVESLWQP
ncbi:hypothetical protein GUITHDRAFT_101707 [Guillardia theta CCMP2712]|uniref:Uncharacterized protein n=1 Tax=Guillardia theta (strain CCMP2712) TaxID=905079 RepID=L1JVC9_GUITC|nr:hypothetical protein GUITHDRAFT_101707 [Guillardia theta CCMP2712]EKX52541.1 hypothetical protein GUITHDRAFT_101707 [Guillardia theta CCMP2712]|eukprot:XP_005839521.1 hypothetical protein GUITHDRAFT_101707 [Guillardia theta CCMP2712]